MLDKSRESIGDNRPPLVTDDQLSRDFSHLVSAVSDAIAFANNVPVALEDDEDVGTAREAVKLIVEAGKRIEAERVDTKAPFLAGERTIDSFFGKLKTTLSNVQAGIETRAKHFLDKKERLERQAREEARRKAEEEERQRREAAAAADRAALEQRKRAEKAAKAAADAEAAQFAEKMKIAASEREAAEKQESEARAAREKELAATAAAAATRRAAEVAPAELARTRVSSGGMATLAQVWSFEVTEPDKVDLEALRPFLTKAAVEQAVRAYINVHKGDRPLAGVRIFQTTKAQMR